MPWPPAFGPWPDALSRAAQQLRCAVDRSFLQSIQEKFNLGGTEESLHIVAWTLAVALVLAGTGILVNQLVIRRRYRLVPSNWITRKEDIRNVFELAVTQRSKIELGFTRRDKARQTTACVLSDLTAENLLLDLSDFIEVHHGWIGRTFECFFRIQTGKTPGQMNFYTFNAEVVGVKKLADGSTQLTLGMPDHVVLQQKRIHMRLEPPTQYVLGLALWPQQLDDKARPVTNVRVWGRPPLVMVPGKTGGALRLVNVSASGLRVEVAYEARKEAGLELEIGQYLNLLLTLHEPQTKAVLKHWLIARVQNRYEDFSSKELEVGVRIVGVGKRQAGSAEIAWRKAPEDGLPELENWVVRRHLEIFREKGLA
ncbi:MAG: hypothetical protein AB1916_03830 [Thermodesulfobacteriota bacterium]